MLEGSFGTSPKVAAVSRCRIQPHCRTGRRMHSDRLISSQLAEPCPLPVPAPPARSQNSPSKNGTKQEILEEAGWCSWTTSSAIWWITYASHRSSKYKRFAFFYCPPFGDCHRVWAPMLGGRNEGSISLFGLGEAAGLWVRNIINCGWECGGDNWMILEIFR